MKKHRNIFLTSLVLTILIFVSGILLNYGLDFVRVNVISDVMLAHELNTQAYVVEQEFTDFFGGARCDVMNKRIGSLQGEIRKVGADLGSYSRFGLFNKKNFDYLKRKYFLLELQFLSHIERLNKECGSSIVPILFFYEIDQMESERQGFILEEVSKLFKDKVVVITLDKDYKDEPLVGLLALKYHVTSAPTIVVDGIRKEGMVYDAELGSLIQDRLDEQNERVSEAE